MLAARRGARRPAVATTVSDADEVEVFVTFERSWVAGYEVCGVAGVDAERTFTVRRQSDGVELPETLLANRIRPANSAPALPPDADGP